MEQLKHIISALMLESAAGVILQSMCTAFFYCLQAVAQHLDNSSSFIPARVCESQMGRTGLGTVVHW